MEVLASMLEAVEEIVDIAAPALLPPEQLAACTERLRAVLAASGERRAERHARRQAEDFDAEEAEALAVRARAGRSCARVFSGRGRSRDQGAGAGVGGALAAHAPPRAAWQAVCVSLSHCSYVSAARAARAQEENEDEEDLLDQLASVLTAVLRKYGDAALPVLAELMPALGALLEPGRDPEERRIAICILDDILEHCPAGARLALTLPCTLGRHPGALFRRRHARRRHAVPFRAPSA